MKYKVRGGYVEKGDEFWWLYEGGPEKVNSCNWEDHDYNLEDYPEVYQIKEPVYKVIQEGVYEGEFVYEHEERFKLMNQGYRTNKKSKTERKRPEFTFEDGVYLGQDCGFHASYLIITMEYSDLYTAQQQIGAVQEYLKARAWQSDYSFKPLRKKLKLYVKWLQSEMSKREHSK